jgi:hypothetical protein
MQHKPAGFAGLIAAALLWGAGAPAAPRAPAEGSLTTTERESAELRRENAALREQLALVQTEAEIFQREWLDLRLRMEALGLEALTGEESALEERVVRLVGELYRSEKRRRELERAVVRLVEAQKVLQGANALDAVQRRAEVEAARRELLRLIDPAPAAPAVAGDLHSGVVTLYDGDLGVVVVNFGRAQGARVGLPFRILRDNRVIGHCRLIEVREYLAAAKIEQVLENTRVQEGDRLLLETTTTR